VCVSCHKYVTSLVYGNTRAVIIINMKRVACTLGASFTAWTLRKDWTRMQSHTRKDEHIMLHSLLEARPQLSELVDSGETPRTRTLKLNAITNLCRTLSTRSNGDSFDCCMNLLSYYDPKHPGGLFLALPHLYATRADKETGIFCSGDREQEAASHYSTYTRDLCMSYFLHNCHVLTYARHLVSWWCQDIKDSVYPVPTTAT